MSQLLRSWSGVGCDALKLFREATPLAFDWFQLRLSWGEANLQRWNWGIDFTGGSRSAVDALLMKCKYNRERLKIPPRSCLKRPSEMRRYCLNSPSPCQTPDRSWWQICWSWFPSRSLLGEETWKERKRRKTARTCRCLRSADKERSRTRRQRRDRGCCLH